MRIAIVRLTSLGDVVHTLPVAAAIREQRPDAFIAWIVEENEQVILRDNPVVDEVLLAPLRRWRRSVQHGRIAGVVREARAFAARLRALRLDVVLDVQGWTHKTSPVVALTRAPRRIGFSRSHARHPWSTFFTTEHVTPAPGAVHIVDQNLALLGPLGFEDRPARFIFPAWSDAKPRVDAWMERHLNGSGKPIVLLASTRGPKKLWPARAYADLARRLAARTGRQIVLAGGPADRPLFAHIELLAGEPRLQSYTPEPVPDLALFLRGAALVVGNDTGPLHLAAAASVPSVGLFGPTFGRRNGPYGPTGGYIQSRSRDMSEISVDAVSAAALRAFEECGTAESQQG